MEKFSFHWRKFWSRGNAKRVLRIGLLFLLVLYFASALLSRRLVALYDNQKSAIVLDRNGKEIMIQPNSKGLYLRPAESIPHDFLNLLIAKEDRFFYYHGGINPLSVLRSIGGFLGTGHLAGSSTITQQLVKNLLGYENQRSVANKMLEAIYAVSLELHQSKSRILSMYADTAYFGNQAEGLAEASRIYFDVPPESLTKTQILELLATLNNPRVSPGTFENEKKTLALAARLNTPVDKESIAAEVRNSNNRERYARRTTNMFELGSLGTHCTAPCSLTIDEHLTDTARTILETNLDSPAFASVKNGAIVIIRLAKNQEENELLAMIGSPHPQSSESGYQINMAIRPRPVGSTAKPFIYAQAFEKGARPYTLVDDTEYKYEIGTGFAFYPKNYDGIYHGTVTLHQALSNSLNVPAVRVLQYDGLDNFYKFLEDKLHFNSLQPLDTYQLSIALGGLEMDLLTLSNYFTVFPNEGILKPLRVSQEDVVTLPMADQFSQHRITDPAYTELVTKILSDRTTGVNQFGLASNLNLPASNYAVKTGTSYDYHDSWTIGYTPDFLVGVWLGNSDNKPMYHFSGSIGAGKIWHEVMGVLLNSPYNKKTEFNFADVVEYTNSGTLEYGLKGDDYAIAQNLLRTTNLILQPHQMDTLQFQIGMAIPLASKEDASWFVDGAMLGWGTDVTWRPMSPGTYHITAKTADGRMEKIVLIIKDPNDQ